MCWFYVWVFRGTPLLVQLFIIFYGLPGIGVNIEAVPAADLKEIRSSTAIVFQNFSLYENKTAIWNIMLPLIKAKKYTKEAARQAALEQLDQVGLLPCIVTHELEFALDVADHVVFMEDGVVVEKGKSRDVLKNPQNPRTAQFLGHFADKLEYVI